MKKITFIFVILLSFSSNSFAFSKPYWDLYFPNLYVANVYFDNDLVASIQRTSTDSNWELLCFGYKEKSTKNNKSSYNELTKAFEDAKKKCKEYPW